MIELRYSGYDRPILESLLDHLWDSGDHSVPDLSDTALLLPTRNVGRRVRESLALRARSAGRAVLSPTVLTPGSLFSALAGSDAGPSRADTLLAAAEAIQRAAPEILRLAFGRVPEGRLEESLSLARFFLDTRKELSEGLLDFEQTAQRPEISDRDRWRALARIEKDYRRVLAKLGLEDPDDCARRIVEHPDQSFRFRRLVLAGTPDFAERVAVFIRKLAETHPVEILILADSESAGGFDDVGRPAADWFLNAPIPIPEDSLHVYRDVHEANRAIADRVARHPDSRSACACGVGTPATGASLAFELKTQGLPAYDPGGRSFSATPAGRFFRNLAGVFFGEEIADWVAWIRDPFVAHWMTSGEKSAESRESWIREADEWMEKTLPNSINDFLAVALTHKTRSRIFARTQALRQTARETGNLFDLLEHPDFRPLLSAVESEEGVSDFSVTLARIRETAGSMEVKRDWPALSRWAVEEASRFPVYEDRPDNAIEVLGWLELLWEEKPWLQIPDFYDGAIPGIMGTHPLLPESLRQALGIPSRRGRDARDAYLLQTLIGLRRKDGMLEIGVPGRDLEGGAVSPSRLLYFTSDDELPARVRQLSKEPPIQSPTRSSLPLRIDCSKKHSGSHWLDEQDRIHVTSFASWIRCPFTFFLERVVGQSAVDAEKLEMDPGLFGTGFHEVMRRLDEDDSGSLDWNDPKSVSARAEHFLDQWFFGQFGRRPGLLLELQKEGLRRRIESAASIRAEARQAGWVPLHIEWNFRKENLLEVSGIPLSGQIDLVEERDGELRIIDYKTKDQAESPERAHLVDLSRKRSFSVSSLLPVEGQSDLGWVNLQLPLYAAALRKKYPDHRIRVAYIQAPRAVTETRLVEWADFDDSLSSSAIQAAETVIEFWRQNGFWPAASSFSRTDIFDWAGADGALTWEQGNLLDLSTLSGEEEAS